MRILSKSSLPLLLFTPLAHPHFVVTAMAADDSDHIISPEEAAESNSGRIVDGNGDDLEDEVMHEIISAGRGDRDEVGKRDQWSSSDHLREASRFDTREGQSLSPRVQNLLQQYRLECDGCNNNQAVEKINAFVLDAKRQLEKEEQHQTLLSAVAIGVALCALVYFFYWKEIDAGSSCKGSTLGGGDGSSRQRRLQIEEQRRRAAAQKEEDKSHRDNAPTWVDNEMKEIWTPKQEKQFVNALLMYGGMSPKARYRLIAESVDEKTKQECLMHHKLQQLIAKEQ